MSIHRTITVATGLAGGLLIALAVQAEQGDESPPGDGAAATDAIGGPAHAKAPAKTGRAPDEEVEPAYNGYGPHPGPRWRPSPPPASAEEAEDPRVAKAMRSAPPVPDPAPRYRGRNEAMKAARSISKRVPTFYNFRATIPLAVWKVNPYVVWRIRPTYQCLADLRSKRVRFRRFEIEEPEEEGAEPFDPDPTPTPVFVGTPIKGVTFNSTHGNAILISCELAARLPIFAEVLARHGVDRAVVVSAYRPRPRPSFHTFGMALDISRFHLREPQRGPNGELSPWLSVLHDFLETPDIETCDPSLLGPESPLGDNERGRRLLAIACELFETGAFSTIITPNYNPGHRDHYHIDVRPDDPRVFIR